jgi:hypothetical protein
MNQNENENVKEEFCPVCIASIPLAFSMATGTGAAMSDENDKENNSDQSMVEKRKERKHQKNLVFYISLIIGLVSLATIIYYKFINKCDDCK